MDSNMAVRAHIVYNVRLFLEILRENSHFTALRVFISHKLIHLADSEASMFPDMDALVQFQSLSVILKNQIKSWSWGGMHEKFTLLCGS